MSALPTINPAPDVRKAAEDLIRCVRMWTNPSDVPLNVRCCAEELARAIGGSVSPPMTKPNLGCAFNCEWPTKCCALASGALPE